MAAAKTASQKRTAGDGGALDVREPAVAYRAGWGGNAAAEFDEADRDGEEDYGAPESVTVHSYEELRQKLEEGLADIEAGREILLDDAFDEILRDIRNGTI